MYLELRAIMGYSALITNALTCHLTLCTQPSAADNKTGVVSNARKATTNSSERKHVQATVGPDNGELVLWLRVASGPAFQGSPVLDVNIISMTQV